MKKLLLIFALAFSATPAMAHGYYGPHRYYGPGAYHGPHSGFSFSYYGGYPGYGYGYGPARYYAPPPVVVYRPAPVIQRVYVQQPVYYGDPYYGNSTVTYIERY